MADAIDQEIEAIKVVLVALSPLSEKARASVLEYVTRRLAVSVAERKDGASVSNVAVSAASASSVDTIHLKTLKEQKKPRSANEMAALVAHFLENQAPEKERKSTINQEDIKTYFKIAEFRLPRTLRVTLPNAKNAGYFDSAGDGEYRLNAVGHNLVVHSMPRGAGRKSRPVLYRKARKSRAAARSSAKR